MEPEFCQFCDAESMHEETWTAANGSEITTHFCETCHEVFEFGRAFDDDDNTPEVVHPSCKNCRFFHEFLSQCRRHSPVLIAVNEQHDTRLYSETRWPVTIPSRWCGEFVKKDAYWSPE